MTTRSSNPVALPANANGEHLRKQAKALLKGWRAQESAALQTIADWHPRPATTPSLREAQLVIARSYGCADWTQLNEAVETQQLLAGSSAEQAERFIALACLRYNGDDREHRYRRAAMMLQQVPAIAETNFYSALVAGNHKAAANFLASQPALATTKGGPLDWPPLVYVTYSRAQPDKQQALALLTLLLSSGAPPDSHIMLGDCRFTALTGAMGEGERGPRACPPHPFADELVTALLEVGADPNDSQGLYNTMFTDSIGKWLPLLIARGLNARHIANWAPKQDFTTFDYLLGQMVVYGKAAEVKLLLQHGANANGNNTYNHKSHYSNALLKGRSDIADLLLAHGAKAEKLSVDDEFRQLCWQRRYDEAQRLLASHPHLKHDAALLQDAAAAGLEQAEWLVQQGFDINAQTPDGRSLLHRFASHAPHDFLRGLLALGANPDLRERHWGATPLGFAIHHRAWEVANVLLPVSNDLIDVSSAACVDRALLLLQRDPSLVKQRTKMGNTPLHVVSQAREEDLDAEASEIIIAALLKAGADANAINNEGLTPLQWYRKAGLDELAEILAGRLQTLQAAVQQ